MLRDQGCAMIVSSHILADLEEVATHIAIIEQGTITRWSETDAFRYNHKERRIYRLVTVDRQPDCARLLAAIDGVADVRQDGCNYTFEYHADPHKAAALLRELISSDVPVSSFTTVKRTLEEAYLQAGVKQVD